MIDKKEKKNLFYLKEEKINLENILPKVAKLEMLLKSKL